MDCGGQARSRRWPLFTPPRWPHFTPPLTLSDLRRWADKHLVVAEGPRAGKPFKIGSPPWAEVLDAMDDPELEQVTIRGSVQSGKTATLIAAALGHMAAGRAVPVYKPGRPVKRTLAARIVAWGRLCGDEQVAGSLCGEAAALRTPDRQRGPRGSRIGKGRRRGADAHRRDRDRS